MPDLLNIGLTGLSASKKNLETTGHNLANANTEGYSRQQVNQVTNNPVTQSGLIQGTGVRVTGISRNHDPLLEKRLNKSISEHDYFKERSFQTEQIENIFNEMNSEGLNKVLNKFYNSFRDLANQPENETVRSVVRDTARIIVQDFHRMRETLDDLAKNIDMKLQKNVIDINQLSSQVARLNQKIAVLEATEQETGDLRDQRDLAIRELSKSFNISTYQDEKNNYVVFAKGVGPLAVGAISQDLTTSRLNKKDSKNNMAGSVELFIKGRPQTPISHKLSGGQITSLVDIRNSDLHNLQKNMDQIAYEFIKTVNAIHRRGFVNRPLETDQNKNPILKDNRPITGINFFKELNGPEDAAHNIDISNLVKDDLSNLVTAFKPNSPGDNRIALAISKLQHEKILEEGTTTLEEHYLSIIGTIGIEAGKAQLDTEQTEGLLAQTQSIKDRLAGVSIDEEAANLVRFQHTYEASAKVMNTADKLFQTILGIGRR